MNKPFVLFNNAGRLRSGWRVAIFLVLWILFSGILGAVVFTAIELATRGPLGVAPRFAVGSAISLVATIVVGWLCGRWLEELPYRSLGAGFSRGCLRHLLLGLLIGGLSLAISVGIAAAVGNYGFTLNLTTSPIQLVSALAQAFLVLALAAGFEEAFFRGYMFQTLSRSGLAWLAIALTAAFFGAVHIGNPNSGTISSIDTVIAGILFGIAYLKTRDLWFPFGIHLMWNWVQGSVFGIEVSGLTELSAVSILKEVDGGPVWLTGGDYGIEGGLASTVALVATCVLIYFMPLRPDSELLSMSSNENPITSVS